MKKKIDYIIVGLGLAGACLAIQLLRRGKSIMVYDTPSQNRASSVAAGLFNPITGKRIVKTWKADEIFSYLHQFYGEVEKELNLTFFYPAPLYTPFRSVVEQNEWMSKSADPAFQNYIAAVTKESTFGGEVKDPIGGIQLSKCGFINTNVFLEGVRKLLIQKGSYEERKLDEESLVISDEHIYYEDLAAKKNYLLQWHSLVSE